MTVGARHLVFRHRVVGELGELHLDLGMTAGTQFFLLMATHLLLWSFVQFVAIKTADIVESVHAGVPAGQVRG